MAPRGMEDAIGEPRDASRAGDSSSDTSWPPASGGRSDDCRDAGTHFAVGHRCGDKVMSRRSWRARSR